MAINIPSENINELDFNEVRKNLLTFVKNNSEFKDYDFEASGLNFLVDLLAYNTQYSAYYLNQIANEMFLDTAQRRKNAVSIAKQMGYLTNSKKAAIANITLRMTGATNTGTITIPRYTVFYGKRIDGETLPFLSWNTVNLNSTNNFRQDIDLLQGQFIKETIVVDNLLLEKKYKLQSPDIDISELDVFVKNHRYDNERVKFLRVHDITLLNRESEIYYLEQDYDGRYQLVFGDDILGKAVKNNQIIEAEYIVSSGDDGNNCTSFDIADRKLLSSTYIVSTNQFSSQGQPAEDIETIRNNARKMFFSQNRTVTEKDCEILVQKYFPFLDSISVWGGEKNTPPMYGTVYCCAKPKGRSLLTQNEKEFITEKLEQLNIITITPKIIDPTYTYIKLDIQVVYNSVHLNIDNLTIIDLVKKETLKYTKEHLLKFNRSFQLANLTNVINDVNPHFMGTTVKPSIYQKRNIRVGVGSYYRINFNNKVLKGSLITEKFVYRDALNNPVQNCYIKENSSYSALDIVYTLRGKTETLKANIGKIHYESGIVELEAFAPVQILGGSTEMFFEMSSDEYLLVPTKEQIFTISLQDISVTPKPFVDKLSTSSSLEKASLFDS